MIRVGSQLTFCSPEKILQRMVVELDEQNILTRIFSLDEGNVEAANTLFFDGILSSEIVSLKQNISIEGILSQLMDYQYYDFSENLPSFELIQADKPLILDFGTNSPFRINNHMPFLARLLNVFSIFDIIAACTYYPSIILGRTAGLTENTSTRLMLWENADLINRKLMANTQVREMNQFSSTV